VERILMLGRGGCGEPRLSMADKRTPLPGNLLREKDMVVCLLKGSRGEKRRESDHSACIHTIDIP